ncbi:hypothetical protein ACS0TY_032677 [Phlomoides rotata]
MGKLNKSQMLKLFVIASLLITTPLLSTSHRPKYLYFILNILILIVGAEAGLLSFFLHSPKNNKLIFDDHHHHHEKTETSVVIQPVAADHINKVVEKRCSDNIKPPSIFFIGDQEEQEQEEEVEVEEELFHKAETFIGNFYKQLKMQREESSNKLTS